MFDLEMWINKRLHKKCGDGGDGIRRSRQEATELMLLDMCMRTHQIICDLIFFTWNIQVRKNKAVYFENLI